MYIAGIVGFALMLVYDINSYTVNNRVLQGGFYAGCLLVVGATAAAVVKAVRAGAFSGAADVLLLSLLPVFCPAVCPNLSDPAKRTACVPLRRLCTVPSSGCAVLLGRLPVSGMGSPAGWTADGHGTPVFAAEYSLCVVSGQDYVSENLL